VALPADPDGHLDAIYKRFDTLRVYTPG